MGPVSVTLLATLLPAGFLIISLLFLSGYLTFQLRASHALAKKAEDEITVSEPPANPRPFFVENRDVTKRLYSLSDAADPTWRSDAIQALINIENIGIDRYCVHVSKYCEPGDEEWAAELLAQLGYTGGLSVPAIFCLLKQWETYRCVMHHILDDVVLKHLSLDGDPEDSLLPFTAEQHRGLRDFYKALEMKKLPPDITLLVSKIPFDLAEDYSKQHIEWKNEGKTHPAHLFNKEVYTRLSHLVGELFGPIVHPELGEGFMEDKKGILRPMGRYHSISPEGLDILVELHLRMMASRQRFEWRWNGETKADGSVIQRFPSLLAFAGPDGMPLEVPKVWFDSKNTDTIKEGAKQLGWEQNEEEARSENEIMDQASKKVDVVIK